jgi:hypothetical protein
LGHDRKARLEPATLSYGRSRAVTARLTLALIGVVIFG